MAQGASDGGERNTGIAAGGLGDGRAGPKQAALIPPGQYVQGHAVLDAPRQVEILGLGVYSAGLPVVLEVDGQHVSHKWSGRADDREAPSSW